MSKYSIESAALLCNGAAISYPGYGVCVSCFVVVFVIEKCVYCFTSAVDLMLIIKQVLTESTIDSEGFKGGTRGAPIKPRDAVSRTAHVGTVGINGTASNSYCCT